MATLLSYYMNDVWTSHGDPFVRDNLVLTGPPWRFALVYLSLVGGLYAVHNSMKRR